MFTGIVEGRGSVNALELGRDPALLAVDGPDWVAELKTGDSIAVNGVCLTVVQRRGSTFWVEAVAETLRRTNLGELKPGSRVNLERAARLGDRLDGHLVTGHVDAVGEILAIEPEGESRWVTVAAPPEVMRYIVPKGSIAVDGISLTVARVEAERFRVAIIPHTWRVTNLCDRRAGDRVNLEADIIGKYVHQLVAPYRVTAGGAGRGQ